MDAFALIEQLASALKKIEFDGFSGLCPECEGYNQAEGHGEECSVGKAIAAYEEYASS